MSRTNPVKKESLSKQLRDIFYILWTQDGEDFETFDEYYDSKMLKLVKYYKKMIK